jgi:hypothetical protein
MYNINFLLSGKIGDFNEFLYADYENINKNVLSPTVSMEMYICDRKSEKKV